VGLTVLLYVLPWFWAPAVWLGWPLVLLSTLAHELSHALAAMMLGGDVQSIRLWSDASGVAVHSGTYGPTSRAIIAAAGPLGPPLFAAVAFLAARRPDGSRWVLFVAAATLLLVLAFWVRNLFGWFFVGTLAALLGLLAWWASPRAAQIACAFFGIELCMASFSRADYLFSRTAQTGVGSMPSDTAQIAQVLFPPYWLWGGLIALVSLAILGFGLRAVFRAVR
jgi:hypothetical protein